jgi:hypothetical protein
MGLKRGVSRDAPPIIDNRGRFGEMPMDSSSWLCDRLTQSEILPSTLAWRKPVQIRSP